MADMCTKSLSSNIYPPILSQPIIMGHWKLWITPLAALDTIWCSSDAGDDPKLDLIRSPTTL
eukprot:scaffold11039_cov96-Skeletonema_dohrnii-CCMP3373.AAC.1